MAVRLAGVDTLAAPGTTTATSHVGFRARFIKEDQSRRIKASLLPPPSPPRTLDVGTVLFTSPERLFLYVSPKRINT
jgi:hypothetical protein